MKERLIVILKVRLLSPKETPFLSDSLGFGALAFVVGVAGADFVGVAVTGGGAAFLTGLAAVGGAEASAGGTFEGAED